MAATEVAVDTEEGVGMVAGEDMADMGVVVADIEKEVDTGAEEDMVEIIIMVVDNTEQEVMSQHKLNLMEQCMIKK